MLKEVNFLHIINYQELVFRVDMNYSKTAKIQKIYKIDQAESAKNQMNYLHNF